MTKRNSLLSLVLAVCLCFMLAVPALAAEDVNVDKKDTLNVMDIVNSVDFEELEIQSIEQVADDNGVQKFAVDIANNTVEVYTDNVNVSEQKIEEYLNRAAYAIAQETTVALNDENNFSEDVVQYIYVDDDNEVRYVEGQLDNGEYVQNMVICKAEKLVDNENGMELFAATDTIPDGIGIRGRISQDGQYISGSFVNCEPENYKKLQNEKLNYYQYLGFATTVGDSDPNYANADMGVVYTGNRDGGGWRPYLLLRQGQKNSQKSYMISKEAHQTDITAVGTKVWEIGESAYKADSPVYITVYKSIGKYGGASGTAVRLSVRGTSAADGKTNVLCVAEAGTGVSSKVNYRVLTTITDYNKEGLHITVPASSNASAPRLKVNYSNLKVAGTNVTWAGVDIDCGKVTSKGAGYITGEVNSK